ncbi:cell division protein FtsL [Brevundimonas bullata]|uniref:cell division protein FtsL n=1 Tax=Brevundimonas bullata TaxID=13160 RepID=UPI002FD8E56D
MIAVPVPVKRLFDWKVRGVRCVEIIGVVCVAALVFSVYIAKAAAARESAEISRIESEIRENRQRVRLLRAEATRLEQPARLEALSREIGLGPVDVRRQAVEAGLPAIAPPPPPPVVAAAPAPVAVAPAAPAAEPVAEGSLH